jgi:hypothetical protein
VDVQIDVVDHTRAGVVLDQAADADGDVQVSAGRLRWSCGHGSSLVAVRAQRNDLSTHPAVHRSVDTAITRGISALRGCEGPEDETSHPSRSRSGERPGRDGEAVTLLTGDGET